MERVSRRRRGWRRPGLLVGLVLAGLLLVGAGGFGRAQPATPAPAAPPALAAAITYLLAQQDNTGAFPGFDGNPDAGTTTDAVIALRAGANHELETTPAIAAAIAFLAAEPGAAYAATGPGQTAKVVLAVVAGGHDPRAFGGHDLIADLNAALAAPATPPAGGALAGESVYQHALTLLALAAANEPAPPAALTARRATQGADGGWAFTGETTPGASDSNTTAMVLQALVATDNAEAALIDPGLAYLQTALTDDGQFLYQAGSREPADANSTALAVQALLATGEDPGGAAWHQATRGLAAFQNTSGGFRYNDATPDDNLLATLQAIPAVAGLALPVAVTCEGAAATDALAGTPAVALMPAARRDQVECVPLIAA